MTIEVINVVLNVVSPCSRYIVWQGGANMYRLNSSTVMTGLGS